MARMLPISVVILLAMLVLALPDRISAQWTPRYTDEVVFRDLSNRGERFIGSIVRNDSVSVRSAMTEDARRTFTQTAVDRMYSNLLKEGGRVREVGKAHVANKEELRGYDAEQPVIVHVPVHLTTKSVTARVVFERKTPLAKVTGFSFIAYEGDVGRDGRGYTAQESIARPPDYADRNLFRERETMIGEGSTALPAMLTMPSIASESLKVPGVVLVGGAEPADLDLASNDAAPFRDISQGLATRGIAALRYTNRAKAHPGRGDDALSSAENVILADAIAAVEALKALPQVDPNRITVVGYRLGGTLAPLIAEQTGASQVILLNAPAPPIDRHLRNWIEGHENWIEGLGEQEHREEIERALRSADAMTGEQLHSARTIIIHPPAFWQDVRLKDPLHSMSNAPLAGVALFFSEGDHTVVEEDREAWRLAFYAAGRRSAMRVYQGLDARFIPKREEGVGALNVSETVINDIELFVLQGRIRDS